MPVSSLDYSLVSAKGDVSLYESIETINRHEVQTFEEAWQGAKVNARFQSLEKHLDPENLSLENDDIHSDCSRAGLWISYLGMTNRSIEPEASDRHSSAKTERFKTESFKKDLLLNTQYGSLTELDIFSLNDLPPHRDEAQVMLDVKRSFTVASQCNSYKQMGHSSYATILSLEDLEAMRKRLYCLIVRVLRKYPCLNYYQGYHDIASIVLLVSSEESENPDSSAFHILEALTLNHLRDFMIRDIALTINHLRLIPVISEKSEPELFELMKHTNSTFSVTSGWYYDYKFLPALSAILTLFSHDLTNSHQLVLVWDFILGHSTVAASAYIYVALLKLRKCQIFETLGLDDTLQFDDVDLDLAHSLLTPAKLLTDLSDSELGAVLDSAARLMAQYPINAAPDTQTVGVWFERFNKNSVIMTTSQLIRIPYARSENTRLYTAKELEAIVKLQESQQQNESEHEAGLLQNAFDQIDSLSTSINSNYEDEQSSSSTLVSSLLSLKAVSSSFNVTSSANLIKRFTGYGNSGSEGRPKRDSITSIYRISLTIGVIGVIIHLLLKQSDWILRFSPRKVCSQVFRKLHQVNFFKLASNISAFVENAKEYGPIVEITEVTQVGLGTVKRSLYSMIFK